MRLPQLYQPRESLSRGLCIPRSDSPVQRWAGLNSEDCKRIVTTPSLQTDVNNDNNPIQEMEKYMHNILEDDDPETVKFKDEYNEALIRNKEV